jgi:predicted esterase
MNGSQEFYQRAEEMFALYFQRRYADALTVTERLAREFPAEEATTDYWRICLLAVDGRRQAALSSMSQSLARGMWWSEEQLRADPDLASLQGNPDFERLVIICRERHAAQSRVAPQLLIRRPEGAGPHPLLIALHGRGSSPAKEFHWWEPALGAGWLLALPQPSQLGSPKSYVWDDIEQSQQEIVGHCAGLMDKYPVDGRRVVVAGFSQGARLAIEMSLKGLLPVCGFMAVSPGKVVADSLDEWMAAGPPPALRGRIVAGTRDAGYPLVSTVHQRLEAAGISCELDVHEGVGHAYPPDFGNVLERALSFFA